MGSGSARCACSRFRGAGRHRVRLSVLACGRPPSCLQSIVGVLAAHILMAGPSLARVCWQTASGAAAFSRQARRGSTIWREPKRFSRCIGVTPGAEYCTAFGR
jgi:hypothetical protein